MFGVNKHLVPHNGKTRTGNGGEEWMLVDGVEIYNPWKYGVCVFPTTLDIMHLIFMIFDMEPLCITRDQENTKDGVVQQIPLADITNVHVRIEVTRYWARFYFICGNSAPNTVCDYFVTSVNCWLPAL